MPLTDKAVKGLKPNPDRDYKRADSLGLFVLVRHNGSKLWRFKYKIGRREKLLAIGSYPDLSLREARDRRDDARQLVRDGGDPSAEKQARKRAAIREEAGTFGDVADAWLQKMAVEWNSTHHTKVRQRLERDVLPRLRGRPIAEIEASEIHALATRIADRGAHETAQRALQNIGAIMRHATAIGLAQGDPTAHLRRTLPTPKTKNFPAITEPKRFGELLRALELHVGAPAVGLALRLAPHVALRSGELQRAEWSEVDSAEALWTIPGEKTKTGADHIVPMSRQVVAIFNQARDLPTAGRYVFASPRQLDRPISNMALGKALHGLGFKDEHTVHGFRASFRTMADEQLHAEAHLLEHSLGHVVRDPLGRSYNRTTHLEDRRALMQRWSDWIDGLKAGGKVVELPKKSARA
jgi:integrase